MADLIVQSAARSKTSARHGWFYVGRLALFGFGILLCLVTLKFFTEDKLTAKSMGFAAALAQPRLDLLLIGSSHARKSYDMRMLEQATGTSSLFLVSYDGADLNSIAQMLDTMAAKPEKRPRHVVVEAYGTLLGRIPDIEDPRSFTDAPPALKIAMLRSYLASHPYPPAWLDVFDLVVNRGNDEIVAYPLYTWAEDLDSYKGGRDDFTFPGMSPQDFRALQASYYAETPNPVQTAQLNHILDLARSRHIDVIFVNTPMPGPVNANPVIQSLQQDFKQIVTARGFPYVDGTAGFPVDDPSLFSDSNHLSSKGREAFTAKIAVQLKAWLGGQPAGDPH
jgi:hypothetical protein